MREAISIADLCGKYGLKLARFYCWKDHLRNNAPEIFDNRSQKSMRIASRAKKDE
jgi:hypothetical protein